MQLKIDNKEIGENSRPLDVNKIISALEHSNNENIQPLLKKLNIKILKALREDNNLPPDISKIVSDVIKEKETESNESLLAQITPEHTLNADRQLIKVNDTFEMLSIHKGVLEFLKSQGQIASSMNESGALQRKIASDAPPEDARGDKSRGYSSLARTILQKVKQCLPTFFHPIFNLFSIFIFK